RNNSTLYFRRASPDERAGRSHEQSNTARPKEEIRRGERKMDRRTQQRILVIPDNFTFYDWGNPFSSDIRN
ncbi:hypothetical protein A2U01_0068408, partial [Trifolium medium]|nr:hypothetical protein [Trifolium medium]